MSRPKLVIFDLETGGLEPHHPDIQVGAVAAYLDELVEIDRFEAKIRFDPDQATAEALEVNSYDPDVWKREAAEEPHVVYAFADWLNRHKTVRMVSGTGYPYYVADLGGHNSQGFDGDRLKAMFERTPSRKPTATFPNEFLPGTFLTSDTLQLAVWFFKRKAERPENFRLSTLCEWFGLPSEADVDHDALAGARASLAVARTIIIDKGKRNGQVDE